MAGLIALDLFLARARQALVEVPVVPYDTPIAAALDMLAAANASALLAVDAEGRLAGLLTERDVVTRVALKALPSAPVAQFMTPNPTSVSADEHLYRILARLRRRGWRHMPVVDADGKPLGLVARAGALAAAGARVLRELDILGGLEAALGDHRTAKAAQIELAQALLDDGLPAPDIQRIVTEINRDLHRHVVAQHLAELGPPPVAFTFLIMGSGGRGESFLAPDQDHGMMLADYPDEAHDAIDAWFVEFAVRTSQTLAAIGFELCKGNVMSSNPVWRKTASQWAEQIGMWIERRTPAALLTADIFFDFEPIFGDPAPAVRLRGQVAAALKRHPGFARAMLGEDRRLKVALGLFGRLAPIASGEHAGEIDLKMSGTMPLVANARLRALRAGTLATGTRARLEALDAAGALAPGEAAGLAAAFETVTFFLLRGQLAAARAGRVPGNYVRPSELTKPERTRLAEALHAIDLFAAATRAEITGRLLG
jgi:CBS domain-containing protein